MLCVGYTPTVNSVVRDIFLTAIVLAGVLVIWFGCVAATDSEGSRKIKASFVARMIFSLWFFLLTLAWFVYDKTRPVFEFNGTIESLQILRSDSRHYSAYLKIHTDQGENITIHVSDRSPLLRVGERTHIQYRGDTNELIEARFYSTNAQQEGMLRSSLILEQVSGMLIGAFLVLGTMAKYRRDMRLSSHTNLHT